MSARVVLALAAALFATACASGPSGGGGPRLAPPPVALPAPEDAADALLGGAAWSARDPAADWGTGYLSFSGSEGWRRVDLPLFDAPDGRHWGWLTEGRGYDLGSGSAPGARADAFPALPGEGRAMLVLAETGGWLEVRWGEPGDRAGGVAWTRADYARGARAVYTRWAEAFRGAGGLVFRNTGVAHNLRSGPGTGAAVVRVLDGDYFDLQVLKMEDDWMRVRWASPPACRGARPAAEDELLGGARSETAEGWIRWRSNDRGSWLAPAAEGACGPFG